MPAPSPDRSLVVLVGLILAHASWPAKVRAEGPSEKSQLWDSLRYPAAGDYFDLVSRSELAIANRAQSAETLAKAQADLAAAIRLSPGRPQAWVALGRLREAARQYDGAAEAYGKASRLDPSYLPRTLGYARAMALLRAGRHLASAIVFRALARPKDPPRMAASLLGNAANAYLAAGHLKTALALFQAAIDKDPGYAPPRWGLAVASHMAAHPKRAENLARVALLLDPEARFLSSEHALFVPQASRHYHLALSLEARGELASATRAWSIFLKEAPRSPWRPQVEAALERLGRVRDKAGSRASTGTPPGAPRPGAPRGQR
ncbi:MAG: hypothetical protein RBU30_14775 [Polyangia bacterium]|jgi:tetratricopeptide (TPR) repeat protein|nr:hypothetical protein [Polyangia bacterium]